MDPDMIKATIQNSRHSEGKTILTDARDARHEGYEPHQIRDVLPHDPLITQKEAAAILGVSPRTLESMRLRTVGPAFVRVSRRCVRYRQVELEKFSRSCTVQTTVIQAERGIDNE